jgi:hypothetical protein
MFSRRAHHTTGPGLLLLLLSIILSLCVYQHYGVSYDEPVQRQMGLASFNYIFHNDSSLNTYIERDHGVGFELPLICIEKALRLQDSSDIYLMRHLASHLFFLLAVFCGYLLALRLFKSQWIACVAFLLLAFNPRLYAHSYFNSKDLPLLSTFLISFFLAEIAFRKGRWQWHVLLGLACGYATSIRIIGIVLLPLIGLLYMIDLVLAAARKEKVVPPIVRGISFVMAFCFSLYIAWPTLWPDPINNFVESYDSMSHFRWEGDLLFFGKTVRSTALPWTYIPGWFCITTPVLWLIAGLSGMVLLLLGFTKKPLQYISNSVDRNFLLYFGSTLLPVFMVIGLHSVLYDDWRHLYFIYPSFVFLALFAITKMHYSRARYIGVALTVVQLVDISYFMIKNHPFQQVYFNQLVSHEDESLRRNFDLDYWGASNKQGLEYLRANARGQQIKVFHSAYPIENNVLILNKPYREQIVLGNEQESDYFLTNFRYHPEDYNYPKVVFEKKVLNSTIIRVYKIR